MRLYLAMTRDVDVHKGAVLAQKTLRRPLRILLSYHLYRNYDLDELFATTFPQPYPDTMADSGAFSVSSRGVDVQMDKYVAWVKRWQHLFTTYANLDVVGDPVATWANQQELEHRGLTPLPVFHAGEHMSWLEHYIERYPYIGLGGASLRGGADMAYLTRCFKMAQGRSVYHGFGASWWQSITTFPWYSVDSTAWARGFKYGEVPVFDHKTRRFYRPPLGSTQWYRIAEVVRSYGFNASDFADRNKYDRVKAGALPIMSYMRAEQWLDARHRVTAIPDRSLPVSRNEGVPTP